MNSFYSRILRRVAINRIHLSTSPRICVNIKRENETETNINYFGDPDTFGTLTPKAIANTITEDEGDLKEEKYLENIPLGSQKLTTQQYASLIKQYIKYKKLKEALDILEVRMIEEDRVKPENYIYNILIGACADVGFTKKAFKLYNDMKRRALKPTGDTYTCLFESCINSPWPSYGLKHATNLQNLMIEKGIEPNLTNYNVMIKAFGRCGDLPKSFQIVDQMISKKIKIRVHTFNHLLQACISDKESGLRHALLVWRKMLTMREKPNVYSFNLMLKCVKECNLGTKENIIDLISEIQSQMPGSNLKLIQFHESTKINSNLSVQYLPCKQDNETQLNNTDEFDQSNSSLQAKNNLDVNIENALVVDDNITLHLINKQDTLQTQKNERKVPNLLSKSLKMDQVLSLQEVQTVQDKFAIVGGQDDFLKEMKEYSVKPDIKTFTQMLPLLHNNIESENKMLATMKALNVKIDIDFYNMLIKKRCMRYDYDSAFDVRVLIEEDGKKRKFHPFNKKNKLKFNIMTYGVLALACRTKEKAEHLLNEMKEKKLKVNIEILGTLLQNAAVEMKFGYILYIMDMVKQENIKINQIFLKHFEVFNEKCLNIIEKNEQEQRKSPIFDLAYKNFNKKYNYWLKEIDTEEALKQEHPWQQFMAPQPETVQRDSIKIQKPKKFYKRSRKFIRYKPSM